MVLVLASSTSSAQDVAIVGVTVVDPSARMAAIASQTVLVSKGVIQKVGPTASVMVPKGVRRVDGTGRFLIPGLWDAHVHFMNATAAALPVYLALGVTSVREMGGFLDSTRAWQAALKRGVLAGPRILTPGPVLEAPRYLENVVQRSQRDPRLGQRILPYRIGVADSLSARRAIDSLVKLRVDFVKIRTTASAESYFALLREAKRAGLKVAGHQPSVVSLMVAVDSGQRDIEHAFFPPLSRQPAEVRDSVYLEFAKLGTWYTPTLVVSEVVTHPADSIQNTIFGPDAMTLSEGRPYAAPWLLEWWKMQVDERLADTAGARPAQLAAREAFESSVADVRRMKELGVLILAGTDAGSVLVYPGFSLHEELALLVEQGGLQPVDALWSATIGPARFAGLERTLGAIAPGQIADLVLLDANPLENIRNTRRINAVVQAGKVYTRADLDTLLARVRKDVTK